MVKVMTLNLRIQVEIDGENQFIYRVNRIIDYIRQSNADIIGIQEANMMMMNLILPSLEEYNFVGEPRDYNGENSGVLYKKALSFISTKTIWLSNTPEQESQLEGSHFKRVATLAVFKIKNQQVNMINTHLDYANSEIQYLQMKVLLNQFLVTNQITIITGDFNANPEVSVHRLLENYGFKHTFSPTDLLKTTFHGFTKMIHGKPIDYIYTNKHDLLEETVIDQQFFIEGYLTDHYPVYSLFNL